MSRLRKFLLFAGVGLLLLAAASLAVIYRVGAWHLVFPSEDHDTAPPELAADFGKGKAFSSPSEGGKRTFEFNDWAGLSLCFSCRLGAIIRPKKTAIFR